MWISRGHSRLAILTVCGCIACGCAGRHEMRHRDEPVWRVAAASSTVSTATSTIAPSNDSVHASRRARHAVSSTNPLRGKPDMVDRLVMVDSAEAFRAGELKYVDLVSDSPARVVLHDTREKTYPRYGSWTSAEVKTDFDFTELIPSGRVWP